MAEILLPPRSLIERIDGKPGPEFKGALAYPPSRRQGLQEELHRRYAGLVMSEFLPVFTAEIVTESTQTHVVVMGREVGLIGIDIYSVQETGDVTQSEFFVRQGHDLSAKRRRVMGDPSEDVDIQPISSVLEQEIALLEFVHYLEQAGKKNGFLTAFDPKGEVVW